MASRTSIDREILSRAEGPFGKLGAFLRLSGPGWLQSAITLGGGSLGGALYLGVLGGNEMLWLQVVAIVIGVIMLSAIAYVTLSTQVRPYQAINQYVNPVLGVGWITATILANMIFILPQFSLCFDALNNNLLPAAVDDSQSTQIVVSAVMAVLALAAVILSFNPGWMSRLFDIVLKIIVGLIVVCFVVVIVYLTRQGQLDWSRIWRGYIPDFRQWTSPASDVSALIAALPEQWQAFWRDRIVRQQQQVIISTTATAVGINMTFLLPYSMIARGWDKPFRGLARWDLITAMAIPFIIVTSCIVMASAHAFHARADAEFLSDDAALIQTSPMFAGATDLIRERLIQEWGDDVLADLQGGPDESPEEQAARQATTQQRLAEYAVSLPVEERKLAATLVKPDTNQLAKSLEPLLGQNLANTVFGLGAFAMGFSTIIILMLINGYAVAEVLGGYDKTAFRALGALLAGIAGFCCVWIWAGQSKTWLIIVASTFAAILLPIAYFAFFLLMNNRDLLGDEKPQGRRMVVWNLLMLLGVAGALAQAILATSIQIGKPETGSIVIGAVVTFLVLVVVGFSARSRFARTAATADSQPS
jgi:Mn2+/Fe2+ NRAMP family transporter